MAGGGFRTFTAGEVLTAANVQDFLMDQAVMNFNGTAARGSALPSPSSGMMAHVGGGTVTVYNGSSWATVAPLTDSGLVKITDQSFSAASTVSVNNCFTSTYANYEILVYFTASPQADGRIRFRASGSDNTTANYQYQNMQANNTAISGDRETGQTSGYVAGTGTDEGNVWRITVCSPQLSNRTTYQNHAYLTISGGYIRMNYGQHATTTSFDGFTIYPTSGTYSGTLRVYGYRN